MAIEPDDKDWTWVLHERCPECGLTSSEIAVEQVGDKIRAALPLWAAVLERPDAGERPAPDVWSPTEYACHVRDVFALFSQRVELIVTEDDPEFANWDQDVTAVENNYAAQKPTAVSAELVASGLAAADVFDAISAGDHQRIGRRSNGSRFTVETLSQYFWHDVAHHLRDVRG